jgi:hypothetical protein
VFPFSSSSAWHRININLVTSNRKFRVFGGEKHRILMTKAEGAQCVPAQNCSGHVMMDIVNKEEFLILLKYQRGLSCGSSSRAPV